MKIKMRDLYAIARFLEKDRELHGDHLQEDFWNLTIDLKVLEENLEEGRLTSVLKAETKYGFIYKNKDKDSIKYKQNYETTIEVYDSDEKRDPVYRRLVMQGPEKP